MYSTSTANLIQIILDFNYRHFGTSGNSYPDAELHIFTTIYFHSSIEASDLSKELAISYKNPHDGGAPEDTVLHIKNLKYIISKYASTAS